MSERYIGNVLRILRKKHGYTLKDLSSKSNISVSYLSDIENGRGRPSIDRVVPLAKALNTSINVLLGLEDIPKYSPLIEGELEILNIVDNLYDRILSMPTVTHKGDSVSGTDLLKLLDGMKMGLTIASISLGDLLVNLKTNVINTVALLKDTYDTCDALKLCYLLGIKVQYSDFPSGFPGTLIFEDGNPLIYLNSNNSTVNSSLTLLNEIGDYLLNHENKFVPYFDCPISIENKVLSCKLFVAEFLIDDNVLLEFSSFEEATNSLALPFELIKLKFDLLNFKNQQ